MEIRYLLPFHPQAAGQRLVRRLFSPWSLSALPGRQRARRVRAIGLLRTNPVFGRPLLSSYLPLLVVDLYKLEKDVLVIHKLFTSWELPHSFVKTLEDYYGYYYYYYYFAKELEQWLRDDRVGDRYATLDSGPVDRT